MSEISMNDLMQKELETLNTARSIEALLNNLNLGYSESLKALANLKSELESYVNDFYSSNEELKKEIEEAKRAIDEVMAKIEEIKPDIESIYELSQSTQTSLVRLEQINTNVTQIEQRIREIISGINLDALESFAQNLKQELETLKEEKIEQIKNALLEETHNAIEQIKDLLKEALDEIAKASGSGWDKVLKECITTKNHALSTLSLKTLDRDKFDRIGSVVSFAARKKEIPSGYVKPNTPLSIIDYAMLYHLSSSKSTDGKTFTIILANESESDYIYSGKEK